MPKLVMISDTHGRHRRYNLPSGDILIHAGDISRRSSAKDIHDFMAWFEAQPHPHKILIAGNHDFLAERDSAAFRYLLPAGVHYLENQSVHIMGLHFWGSPVTPTFMNMAFNRKRGEEIGAVWQQIPETVDVLITHGPPFGILDRSILGTRVGCKALSQTMLKRQAKVHIFGHIHEAYGRHEANNCTYFNAALARTRLRPARRAWTHIL